MAKAKVTSATTTGSVTSTEADDPSRHSRILTSAGIHKKAFHLSAILVWDIPLPTSAYSANQRIIHHLGHSPTEILLGIQPNPLPQFHVEGTAKLVHTLQLGNYIESLPNHRKAVKNCIGHTVELRAKVAKLSEAQKEKEKQKYNHGVKNWTFKPQNLVILHQKKPGKLQPRWRGPFMIENFASSDGKSYKIRQIGGRDIKAVFHGDHLKELILRRGSSEPALTHNHTIRKPRSGEG